MVAWKNPLTLQFMWFFWALIFVEIGSIIACLWGVRRLHAYIRRYRFNETVYSLLFGFMHLHYFVYAYLLSMGVVTVTGVLFAFSLLSYDVPA